MTDRGLEHLAATWPKLEGLHLAGSPITDAGLKQLHSLKSLTKVYLKDAKVTEAGVAELRKALPRCEVNR